METSAAKEARGNCQEMFRIETDFSVTYLWVMVGGFF
jgi:hypothetical protein